MIGLVVGLTIAVLVATGAMLTYARYRSANEQQRLVVNNYETISLMRQALIVLQDTEIGQRAYLLTGDIANLEPYERARLRLDPVMRQLEAAIGDDGEALRQIAEFRTAAVEKLSELNATIVAFQLYGREAVMPRNAGRATTDRIRQIADAFVEGQRLMLSSRLAALRSEQEQADLAGVLVLSGAFACLVVGMYLIVRGGSRLEEAQQQLSARSQLLQATLETLQDPIFVLDAEGHVVAWNDAFVRLADWDPARDPMLGREQLLSERFPATRALLLPLRIGDPGREAQLTARVSYEGLDYEVSRGEMANGGAVVRCVDVTEKLRDEAALRQGQKMEAVGQLTGGMAHDFNNILQVIQANLDLMKANVEGSPEALGRLASATAAADRGARLTQQLLAFARRQPLAPQPTSVARMVADMGDLLRNAIGERVQLEVAIDDDAWNARIDPGQLENAILNLALNARDAMPDGGTVRIEVSNATLDRRYAALHPDVTPGPYVAVAVSDTGTGMPADVIAQAFDPFFTTKNEGRGTGLGLSMVYGFVRQSNGHIRIDSAIGQGTSVKLYLPRTLDPVAEPEGRAPVPAPGSERILVVEDNEEVRRAVVDMLKGWGYRVVAVESPDAAAQRLETDQAFDLLFTDVVMPGVLSAIELVRLAQQRRPGIGVLLTSGYTRDLIPTQEKGADLPLIAKPYRSEELAARVRAVLAARQQPAAPAPPVAGTVPEAGADHPRRVLFVEDEVVLRMSTVDMLERLGCLVAAVGSAEQALELLDRGSTFEVLLTDLGLPGMSGEELAAEVRRRIPALPVIIATGYGKSDAPADGGLRFIGKPYSSVDLQQALDEVARRAATA
jgi:signal transduction histidine kinase/DNA-binding response OmpR family regulator/CHASE3 domain sensor protein